jgi:hypothetical protein
VLVRRQQGLEPGTQGGVAVAGAVEKRGALGGRPLEGSGKQGGFPLRVCGGRRGFRVHTLEHASAAAEKYVSG